MVDLPFTEATLRPHGDTLLRVARRALVYSVGQREVMPLEHDDWPPALSAAGMSFVTLTCGGDLRGCIGSLQARGPLLSDIVQNTYSAACRDPRFAPVAPDELGTICLDISVLMPPQALEAADERSLLNQLRPGVDGLVLEAGSRRATFLPSVWSSLPEPQDFLDHLRLKAGLPRDFWGQELRFFRYKALIFKESDASGVKAP
ncbi:AmmeMemoRadiSam system protein A [Mangrovitalea sediminis]|uniref:AmmeMemoRadiSam system protein A n=1 Tax=Mangrovitalea sediminis TaxID=1982043 RepID=UPI000BE590B8|nr:AmmeMemoRadiSam system protein A [Mangrovitalea sediminis]